MKTAKYFAGAALLVLPFIFSLDGEQLREPKARMLFVMFGLWIATVLYRRVHPSLGCGAGFLLLSACFTAPSFPFQAMIALCGAFGSCLWVAGSTKNEIERGLKLLELSGLLCASYAACQYAGFWLFLTPLPGALPFAVFGQQTLYGPFAVACFASALFGRRHIIALLLFLPIPILASSFTYLSLVVVLFVFAVSLAGIRRAILGVCIFGLVLLACSKIWPNQAREALDDKNRFTLWGQTLTLAKNRWILGHGFGSFRVIYPAFQDPELRKLSGIDDEKQSQEFRDFVKVAGGLRGGSGIFLHPHNEAISVFFEHGALGLLIALWWVAAFVIALFHRPLAFWYAGWMWGYRWWRKSLPIQQYEWALCAIFFSFIANAMGNFPFHLIPQALLPLWAFVAVTTQREDGTLEEDAT